MCPPSSVTDHSSPGSTDDQLIAGIRARDEDAWTRFVEAYSPLIYLWCRRFDLQPADALDVSQQVFHAVSRSIVTFTSTNNQNGAFRGWLFVVTRNQILNYLTRTLKGPRPQGGSSIQMQLLQQPESVDEPSLSTGSHTGSMQQMLDRAKADFDDHTWQCFWLMVMEGRTAVEVGQQLEMQPSAVRQAKYRVTKRLRRDLEDFV